MVTRAIGLVPAIALLLISCDPQVEQDNEPSPAVLEEQLPPPAQPAPIRTANALGGLERTSYYNVRGITVIPKEVWRYELGASILNAPLVDGGTVVAATATGALVSIHAGAVEWVYRAGEAIVAPPVAAGDSVYVVDIAGAVHAVERSSGAAQWTVRLTGPVSMAPGVTREALYALSDGGVLYVLERETGKVRIEVETVRNAGFAVNGGVVYLAGADGSVVARSASDGGLIWQHGRDVSLRAGPVVVDEWVVVAFSDGVVQLLDKLSGTVSAEIDNAGDVSPYGLAAGESLYVATTDGRLHSYSLPGLRASWTYHAVSGYTGPVGVSREVVYAVTDFGDLSGISIPDGTELFRYDTGLKAIGPPTPVDGGILIAGEDGLVVRLEPGDLDVAPPEQAAAGIVRVSTDQPVTRPVPGERDILVFTPERGGTYEIRLPNQGEVEMIVDVFDEDGAELGSNLDKVSLDSNLSVRMQAGTNHILEVYPVRTGMTEHTYTLKVVLLRDE